MTMEIGYELGRVSTVSDEPLDFGPVALEYDTVDANAGHLKFSFPSGTSTQVPVMTVGVGVRNVDLGLFNGNTQPGIAVVDLDRDSYLRLSFSADDTPAIQIGGSATSLTVPTLASPTLATPTIVAAGWANANHTHAGSTTGGNITLADATTGTLAVGRGGTGATSLTDGGVLLGSATGAITALAVLSDSEMIVGNGSTDPVAESGATLRTSIGVGTGDSPQFTGIELGHATDTTLTKASSGDVNIEGNIIYRAGGTDVAVVDGGTGVSTLTDGGVLLGSGTGAITALAVLADSEMIVGNGSTDPVAESGATLRTSIGVGTGDSPQFTNLTLTGALAVNGTDIPSPGA